MQRVVKNPFTCTLVVATEYVAGFASTVEKTIMQQCGNAFSEIVLCEKKPEMELQDIKAQSGGTNGKKLVMVLQGPVGGKAIQYLCDDTDKPIEERRVVWIHSLSVGLDYYRLFDFPQLFENIPMTNGKSSQSRALAEHVLYAITYFNRKTWEWKKHKAAHRWAKVGIQEMYGQRMLILGYGDIGEATAKLAVAAGIEVRAIKRSLPANQSASPYLDRFGAQVFTECGHDGTKALNESNNDINKAPAQHHKEAFEKERARMISESDYVVNIMPGTPDTMKFFNKDRFASMKSTALYVNIGRGCTNDEKDLVEALKSDMIRGAALDVFEVEPLDTASPLWDLPDEKLMLTCHSAAQTIHQLPSLTNRFVSLCERWKNGEDLASEEINREFWY